MITLTREEAQQVLDALEQITKQMLSAKDELAERGARPVTNTHHQKIWDKAFAAYTDHALPAAETLRARLAEKEQEPVAWGVPNTRPTEKDQFMMLLHSTDGCQYPDQLVPLYTAPPQREFVGLTDEEIRNEANHHVFDESFFNGAVWARGKIKEKNNG